MKTIILRPAEPDRDFGQMAAWYSSLQGETTSEHGLKERYKRQKERIVQVAEDEQGELLGFYWIVRQRSEAGRAYFNLFVEPEQRGQGVGSRLYGDLVQVVEEAQVKELQVNVWDACLDGLAFAERRGFNEIEHQFAMELDLDTFDDRPYDEIIASLEGEGFQFTSMEGLGNTEEAQRKLYILNDTTDMDVPGTDGEHGWDSFEDFQRNVCQADWYEPGGQMVVTDRATGAWAAMSAIILLEGNDCAYNQHTGVDRLYRGRKLGLAVKVTALRYARDVLKVHSVRTDHNTKNMPMVSISRKLGYKQMPGNVLMEKTLA